MEGITLPFSSPAEERHGRVSRLMAILLGGGRIFKGKDIGHLGKGLFSEIEFTTMFCGILAVLGNMTLETHKKKKPES